MKTKSTSSSVFRNWYWMWLISAGFITAMIVFFFTKYPAWFHFAYRGVSLSHEMNYAVWWSGICLFMAAIIFANVGRIVSQQGGNAAIWFVLSLAMVGLCIDEVGSLHEAVARVGGWRALLPFALVFALAFGYSLMHLLLTRGMRVVALLIILGLSIFASVAGLEFLEHDLSFIHGFWRRARLVGEEASELIAMGLIITAGLIAMARAGDGNRSVLNSFSVANVIMDYPFTQFTLLAMNVMLGVVLVIPNYTSFPEGNPLVLYPMLLFFLLSIICFHHRKISENKGFWLVQGLLFLSASLLQMYNLNVFVNNIIQYPINLLTRAPFSWMTTLIPFAVLGLYKLKGNRFTWRFIILTGLLLFLFLLIVVSDLRFRYRIESLYFIFSSLIAYCSYTLIRVNLRQLDLTQPKA